MKLPSDPAIVFRSIERFINKEDQTQELKEKIFASSPDLKKEIKSSSQQRNLVKLATLFAQFQYQAMQMLPQQTTQQNYLTLVQLIQDTSFLLLKMQNCFNNNVQQTGDKVIIQARALASRKASKL